MIKIRLLSGFLLLLLSFSAFAQFPNPGIEGFENTTGPDITGNVPSPWTLSTGVPGNQWAVFSQGSGNGRWNIFNQATTPPTVCEGSNTAHMNRVQQGANGVHQGFLATPRINVPNNGQLRFLARTFILGNQGTFYDIKIAPGNSNQMDPASYTLTLATFTEDQLSFDDITGVQNDYTVCTRKILNFPANLYNQSVYVAFVRRHTQGNSTTVDGDRFLIDAVQLNERCLDPLNPTTGQLNPTSAELTWGNPSGATTWQIEIVNSSDPFTGNNTILYTGALPYLATTTTGANGAPLVSLGCYKYRVKAICSGTPTAGITSDWSATANFCTTQAPPLCGQTYLDPGGTSNYPNNANSTLTVCPSTTGELVTVTFTSFATQAGSDILSIYDGGVATPSALLGSFSGTAIPPAFTSSAANGCLTFVFVSNATTNAAGWVANITCAPPPACQRPTAVVTVPFINPAGPAVTHNSINFGWTAVGAATSFEYIILPCTAAAPTAASIGIPAPTNPFNITGLNPITCYKIYVRGICPGIGSSDWSVALTVTTLVAPPICGGSFVDSGGPSAAYSANENNTVTICPTVAGQEVTVTFSSFNTEATFDGLYVYAGASAANGILIPSNNPAGNAAGPLTLPGAYWGATLPGPFTGIAANGGCLTFVFMSNGTANSPGWLGSVTCAPPVSCPRPLGLVTSNVTYNTATVSWLNSGPATSWQVLALPCNSPAPSPTATGWVTANTNSIVLNLNPSTCYNIYVRSDCGAVDGVSLWSGPVTVNTPVAPPVCGGQFIDAGGPNANYPNGQTAASSTVTICPTIPGQQVTVTFSSFFTEANWDGLYVYDNNTATPSSLMPSTNPAGNGGLTIPGAYWGNLTGNNLPGPFTASSPNGCLTFVFISDPLINNPGWVASVTCAPPPTCPRPTAVQLSNQTATSITVAWTEMGTATQWQVLVLPASDPAPTATTTGWQTANATTYLYTPLNPAVQQFKVYVRAVCNPNDISLWSAPVFFNRPPITTSTTLYTTTQLVENVLLNSSCATVTNITSSTGSNFNSVNGIGYFNQNGSSFPFADGIILMTGSVTRAPGPNTEGLSDGVAGWGGDTQLYNYIQGLGIDAGLTSYNNASKLEFDFVPLINTMSFDFIFASEEYGGFQCAYTDAFAFFLTNNATGVTTNLAVLPSTNIPISVTTIRNQLYNNACASVNPQYFDKFYGAAGNDIQSAPIDFNGHTVPLTASSSVIPGQSYHIKLVIADRNDSLFDSAVFLKGSSFNIGSVNLGNNLLQSNNTALCNAASYTIVSGLNPAEYTFAWTFNGNPIPNQSGPNLTVTQTGLYAISATYNNTTCASTGQVTIEFYDPVNSGTPNNMSICSSSGFGQFTLSQNNTSALGTLNPANFTVVYYASTADASAEINPLPNAYTNVVQFLQTIYVKVKNTATGCFTIKPFNLIVQDLTAQFTISQNFTICSGTSGTITVTPINYNNSDVVYSWTLNGNPFPGTTNQITVTQAGTYVVSINHTGCLNTGQTVVTVAQVPVPDAPQSVTVCASYTLPALTVGNYFSQPNGQSPITNLTLTASQTVYVFAQTGTSPNCTAQNTFQVTINQQLTPTFAPIGTLCINSTPPALPGVSTNPNNPITGSWSPSVIDTSVAGTSNYTFTPNQQFCALPVMIQVTVGSQVTPTFAPIATTVCQGSTPQLLPTVSNNPNSPIAGSWLPSAINTAQTGITQYTFTPNAGQCAATVSISVDVIAVPVINPVNTVNVCNSYLLPALSVGGYFSQTNGQGPITNLTLTTTQRVYVFAQSGTTPNCTDEESFMVNITPTPQFTIAGGCNNSQYVLEVDNANFNTDTAVYSWSGPGNVTGSNSSIVVTIPGTYTLTVVVANGSGNCTTSVSTVATDISCQIPLGISPNNDGRNDTLDLSGFNVSKLSIYNRYGKDVYSKTEYTNEWGGQSDSGNELPDGTYFFVMERGDGGETKTGWVYINRER